MYTNYIKALSILRKDIHREKQFFVTNVSTLLILKDNNVLEVIFFIILDER